MAKIEWNKVTPLSKFIALALFVALPFLGFYYGIQYGEAMAYLQAMQGNQLGTAGNAADAYYKNVAVWQTDVRSEANAGFSIAYPLDFEADNNYAAPPSYDWRLGANGAPGNLFFTLTIPRAFEPQTNFADAKLTIASSHNGQAVADCMKVDASGGPRTATSSAVVGGVPFTIFPSNGAGAGNYYETTSYRAVHDGACWAIEYTIHSSQIANYPAEYELKPFDKARLVDVLDRIVHTFTFQ